MQNLPKQNLVFDHLPPPPRGKKGWPWEIQNQSQTAWKYQSLPKITIITPSYNQAPFLEETIRSVLLQGYPELEYIIIDGGSSDQSVEIIQKYAPWLGYWVSEPDQGQSDALNKGLEKANGEYIGWLNSDDTYSPGEILKLADFLYENPDVDAVYSDIKIIDENSHCIGGSESKDAKLEDYLFSDFIPQQSCLFRKKALLEIGKFNKDLKYVMDYDLFLRLMTHHTLKRIPGACGNFRVVHNTKSTAFPIGFLEENILVLERFFQNQAGDGKLKSLRNKALSAAYLNGASRAYGAGLIQEAQEALLTSLELYPDIVQKPEDTIERITGWAAYPVIGNPFKYIYTVVNNLPEPFIPNRRNRRRIISQSMINLLFNAYKFKNWPVIRQAFILGLFYNPQWIFNRGVISLGVRAFGRWVR